jgi:hypothetical protein
MDVLRYSATNAKNTLQSSINAKNSCIDAKTPEINALQVAGNLFTPEYRCWVQTLEPSLLANPAQTSLWSCIPTGSGWTSGFTVCGADGVSGQYFSQGRDCVWTVPDGVTCARFQVWGAGSGSGSGGMCCSISPFGGTGAFLSVIIPVTSGTSYTIHSGCAIRVCSYCTFSCQRPDGDKSFVQGPGLCNFCAEGGIGELGKWMTCNGRSATSSCYFGSKCSFCCGYAVCGEGGFGCWSATGRGVCCILPFTPAANYFGNSPIGAVYGIRGMFSALCSCGMNNAACYCHPPIYGFLTTSQCTVFYDGTCCGSANQACCGVLRVPGAGGWPSTAFGGSNQMYGDCSGKFGMVCVCFK